MNIRLLSSALALTFIAITATPALAKPARCFSTEYGNYDCNFIEIDGDGSFRLSAKGYRSYTMEMLGGGAGKAMVRTNDGSVPLPGTYYRAKDDGACWENTDSADRICAW